MKQMIKWQTGEPHETGSYIVSVKDCDCVFVSTDYWCSLRAKWQYWEKEVVAWRKLSDIEPYKEAIKPKRKCCGECRFYRKAELDPKMARYDFDGVCIVEPPTLETSSKTVSCHLFKPITD